MFGKAQKIRDLERLVRVRTAERDEARGDYKAAHADLRYLVQQLADQESASKDLARHAARLQERLDHAVGLDSPALDAGARWQERRHDKVKGVAL
ncbi:hypothetical protein ABZY44_13725 [Streptomyces sp. NPDC006544]|uniref:hypothetical protein n=1 Tax=Streptomyces sp. NPDC006544 TaxID=3154583 RepID=UPI0033B88602